MIKKYVNLRTFSNPENQLADKNQLFPCLRQSRIGQDRTGPVRTLQERSGHVREG